MGEKGYKSVKYDPDKELERELENQEFRAAWESLKDEFAALDALLAARERRVCRGNA